MSLPWFRTYTRLIDDEKLKLLAFEDRWHFMAILCCKGQGILDNPGELMRRKVAVKLGLAVRELDEVARRLSEVGLIDAETLQPVSWDKLQFVSDRDPQNAFRQREYRRRMREGWPEYIAKQDGKCACCGKDFETPYAKYVVRDHDHKTGDARGLVCQSCNKLIGQVENGRSCDQSKLLMVNTYLSSYVSVTLRNGHVTAPDTETETDPYSDPYSEAEAEAEASGLNPVPSRRDSTTRTTKNAYPPDFEQAWSAYPKRAGGNSKALAFKAWKARIKSGIDPGTMLLGVMRYAAYIDMTGKVGTEYVQQAATFFGPAEHFNEPWDPPQQINKQAAVESSNRAALEAFARAQGVKL